MSNAGFVYAISNGRGAVKIGWSSDPWRRLRELNTHDAATCFLLGATPGTREHEKEAHKLLSRWRILGEWFDMTARPVLAFVMMLGKKILEDRELVAVLQENTVIHPLQKFLNDNNLSHAGFAKLIESTQVTVSRYIAGLRTPKPSSMAKIVKATAGKVTANDFFNLGEAA